MHHKHLKAKQSKEIIAKHTSLFQKIMSVVTAYSLLFMNIVPAYASDITGIAGNNGVYDIDAAHVSGNTGFRQYTNFTLDNGDVANLKFDQGYNKFVNLVDNQVNINGVLNTVKGGAFYNGHAIFVSPNGMVVGASGVLNVGSLTVSTPSADKYNSFKNGYAGDLGNHVYGSEKYNELINDSHGNITINGKIIAKENVELYGDHITVAGTQDNRAGIVAGADNQIKLISRAQAEEVFNNLVSNNIQDADSFALEDGKIKIVAGFKDYIKKEGKEDKPNGTSNEAVITIQDANLGANEVEMQANTIRDAYVWATSDEAISSKIDITRSDITADNIDITANSEDYYGRNVNLTVPAVYFWVFDADDHDAHISDFFTESVYNGFEGVRTSAIVNVKDSALTAAEDLSIDATTSSKTGISTDIVGQFIPSIFYGYGTKTETKINVENSTLTAGGDIDLNAYSENILKTKIWDDIAAGLTLRVTDAFNLVLMKNSAVADTQIVLDNSTLEAENVRAQALAYNEMDNEVVLQERIGKNDFTNEVQNKGGSAVSLGGIINVSDIKSGVTVKNGTQITTEKDVTLKASNVNDISNWMDAEIKDPTDYTQQKKWEEGKNWFSKRLQDVGALASVWDQLSSFTLKDFATKFQQKGKNLYDIAHPELKQKMENATLQAGVAAVWNNVSTNNNVTIDNSVITAGKNMKIRAHTIDNTVNEADGYADETANWGGALGMVVNKQHNDNSVNIINTSNLTAEKDIDIDSIVELPAQQGSIGLAANIFGHPINLAVDFGFNADDEWEFGFHNTTGSPLTDTLMPKAGVFGFYNNFAVGSSAGEKASASGAVIYSELKNNANLNITNSALTANTGDISVNSIVSASAHDAADFFNYDGLIDEIKALSDFNKYNQESGSGLGAAVIVQNFTNNANLTVDNAQITAEEGNVDLNAAAEQSYLTILTPGGKAESIGVDGAVNVQEIFGTTAVNVKNGTQINAQNISIDAGKANGVLSRKGTHMADTDAEFVGSTGRVILDYEVTEEDNGGLLPTIVISEKNRDIKDHVTSVVLNGSFTKQSEETTSTTSSGAAVGASVSVQGIERTVEANVQNSQLTAANDISVKADSREKNIFVTLAGAFAGGVETPKDGNSGAGGDGNTQQNVDNAQDKEDDDDLLKLLYEENDEIFNDLIDNGDGEDNDPVQQMRNSFSLGAAGSVVVLNDQTDVRSSISNSALTLGKDLNVTADRDSWLLTVSGGLAKSHQYTGGAAVNVYKQDGSVQAHILDNTQVNFTGADALSNLNVKAHNDNELINVAVGVAASTDGGADQKADLKAAIGGSVNVNTLKPEVAASLENSTVSAENAQKLADVTVKAENEVDAYNVAGGGSYVSGGNNAIGAGAAVNYNNVKHNVHANVINADLDHVNKLSVLSKADNDMNDFAVAGSLVSGDNTAGWAFDGSADINYFHDTVKSGLLGSTVNAANDIEVKADSNTDSLSAAGTLNISTAQSGIGANGDVIVNIFANDIGAAVDHSYKMENLNLVPDRDSNILSAHDINVAATSAEKVNDILAGVAFSTKSTYLMGAANVNINDMDNVVKAYLSGNVGTGENAQAVNNVNVAAYDETTIYSRGGTLSGSIGSESGIVIAGSVDVDSINKTVESKIADAAVKSGGDVAVSAVSVTSMGGTKADNNQYSREDVTSEAYRNKLLHQNSAGLYDGLQMKGDGNDGYISLDQNSDFENWNMFFDLAGGVNTAVAGAGIGKVIENTVTAEIANSSIEANNLYVLADDYSIKNIIAGTIAGSLKGGVGLSVLYNKDNSTTSALVGNNSALTIANNLTVDAANEKDTHLILIAGSGAAKGSINANIAVTDVEDKVYAKIDNGAHDKEISAANIALSANEDINAAHIVVSGGGAGNLAVDVNPIVNTYDQTVESTIANSKITGAAIDMDAVNKVDSLDVAAGIAGSAKGFTGVGVAIANDYTGNVKSYMDNAVINTQKDISLDADSVIDANNWIVGGGAAGQGASVVANVLLNDIASTVEAGIKNSSVENAGAITVNTNKDQTDRIDNNAIAAAFAGQGLDAIVNVIKNDYENTVTSYVDNTESGTIESLALNSNSDRRLNNTNFGLTLTGQGAGLAGNALANEISSTTRSYVDAKDKTLNVDTLLQVNANDLTAARNNVIMGSGALIGGAVGVNINLYTTNNLAKAELLSDDDGQINAGSTSVSSVLTDALDNTQVDLALGLAAIPIDVQIIEIGKPSATYSQAEQVSNVDKYVDSISARIPQGLTSAITPSEKLESGAIARENGNVKTVLDNNLFAQSRLWGLNRKEGNGQMVDTFTDRLDLNAYSLIATGASVGVGVRDVQIANNTVAEITGGKIESTDGNVKLDAQSAANVYMGKLALEASAAQVSGGSDIYEKSAETIAQIKDADITAYQVSVNSKSKSHSTIDTTHVPVSVANIVNVDLTEAKDTNKTVSRISGNTNITTTDKLTLHSTLDSALNATKLSVPISAGSIVSVMKNEATANAISKAVIEDVNGTISTNGLDIITDYDQMDVTAKSNIVSVKGISFAEYNDSGAFMNAYFKSGVDSEDGLILHNSGKTTINTAKDNTANGKGMYAFARTHDVSVQGLGLYTGAFANAQTEATSATVLKAKEHTADELAINPYLKTTAKADDNGTKVTLAGVYALAAEATDKSTMTLDIGGSNTIANKAIIKANHDATTNADLKAFNLGLLVSGSRLRLKSDMEADTIANIGGDFNVGNYINTEISTNRTAVLDKTSGTGGFINVADTGVENTIKGNSTLNLGLSSDTTNKNRMMLLNSSVNTYHVKTTDGSGGFINVSDSSATSTVGTTTETNIENADIHSLSEFRITTTDAVQIEDDSSNGGGGVISYVAGSANNNYSSTAKINVKDSNVKAQDVTLHANSGVITMDSKPIHYTGDSGGVVAFELIDVGNTINNSSEINIKNSALEATRYAFLETNAASYFKQKIESGAYGLLSKASGVSKLVVTNNNTITLDDKSSVLAGNELQVNFDSSNQLMSRVFSDVSNFAGEPVAKSYLDLTINNTLINGGSLQGGNMLDINFMPGSNNYLTQYSKSVSTAAIASTTEDGLLTKKVNNVLENKASGNIISGKDLEFNYSSGGGESDSTITWTTKSAWGIIEDSGTSGKYDISSQYALGNDGKVTAGANNSKYMKINRDGTIDKTTLKGFYDGDYILNDGAFIDGETLKEKALEMLSLELENIDETLEKIDNSIAQNQSIISSLNVFITDKQAALDEINTLIENGAVLLESRVGENGMSAFDLKMQQDMGCIKYSDADPDAANKITQAEYNTLISDYQQALSENSALTLGGFLEGTDYGFSAEQKANIVSGYESVTGRLFLTDHAFNTYTGNDGVVYIAAINPTGTGTSQTCTNIDNLNSKIESARQQIEEYNALYTADLARRVEVEDERYDTLNEYNAVWNTPASAYDYMDGEYSIVFNDIRGAKDATITLSGITNANIHGNGTFNMTKSGLQIDNYSTRSLVFNDINTDTASAAYNFFINGKSQAEFADKPQALSGTQANAYINPSSSWWNPSTPPSFASLPTTGVHYVTSNGEIVGTNINNYYDNNHPFADTLSVPNSILAPNIAINGDLKTGALNILNESGDITIQSEDMKTDSVRMYATNGQVDINVHDGKTNNATFTLGAADRIFAANGINITADNVSITNFGLTNLKTGYSVRGITITDDMLKAENLIVDPTTGEKNLINLSDNRLESFVYDNYKEGNIKAIYKDGQIYLYNLPKLRTDNGITITANSGNVAPNATTSVGGQSITINNQTDKALVVGNIDNTATAGTYTVSGGATKQTNAEIHEVMRSKIDITSNGMVFVNGVLTNGLDGNGEALENSLLRIQAGNGLDIAKHQMYSAITAAGTVDLISANGPVNLYGKINHKKGDTLLQGGDGVNVYGELHNTEGNVTIKAPQEDLLLAKGSTVVLEKGDLNLHQQDMLGSLRQEGQIILFNGSQNIYSLGNETNNGLVFVGEFMDQNDVDEVVPAIISAPEITYVLAGDIDYGYDVTQDKDLNSNVKILRLHRSGATIVNEEDWKVGERKEITLKFEDVDVTVKCKVVKVENGMAQVAFSNIPQAVANKISGHYMNQGLFHNV